MSAIVATLVLPSGTPGATKMSAAHPLVEEVQGQEGPQEGGTDRKRSKEGAGQSTRREQLKVVKARTFRSSSSSSI